MSGDVLAMRTSVEGVRHAVASAKGTRLVKLGRLMLALWAGLNLSQEAIAVPADPTPIVVQQPDGKTFKLRLRGDEFFSWRETVEGYAVVKDADGFWKYARPVAGRAAFAAVPAARVGSADPAGLGLKKHALPDAALLRAKVLERRKELLGEPAALAVPASGAGVSPALSSVAAGGPVPLISVAGNKTIRNVVILACFSDHWDSVAGTVTNTAGRVDVGEYSNLFNQAGYTADGAAGSVRDYYREVSYGKLTIQSIIVPWVKLPRESAYYGQGVHGGIPGVLAADAVEEAAAAGFDFSQGDSDGDGWVDVLDIIHSGFGEESTGYSNDVWSVKGAMSNVVTKSGVMMYNYHTEPALRGSSGTGIERIGTICHESGHFFGLPDLYDYSPTSDGLGDWCLMSGGPWNGVSGTIPAHFSAWCKTFLGFARARQIHSVAGLSLPRVEDNPVVGMLRDGTTNGEYFLVENRAKTGFDNSAQIYPGLVIYHVDLNSANNDLGTWPHPAVKIEEADGNDSLGSQTASSEAGDTWTGTSGIAGGFRDQTGNTNTSAMLYQDGTLYSRTNDTASFTWNALNNFSAAGSNMTFDATTLKPAVPAGYALPADYRVTWRAGSQAGKYEIQEGVQATLTNFYDGAEDDLAMYENWCVAGKTLRVSTNVSHGGSSSCYAMLQANYGSVQALVMQKPFKVTTSTLISFYFMSHISVSNGFLKCEISNDDGSTWRTLGTYNDYIDPWSLRSYDFTAINAQGINAGDMCILRFLADIEYPSGWSSFPKRGFAIDDISITGTEIAGYGGWTSLSDNVTTNSFAIAAKPAGVYAYRVQAYANGEWQGFGPEGEITVHSNQTPGWTITPVAGVEAYAGTAYNGNLSSLVTDEMNDVLTFSKVSGPAWLNIKSDGTLAGVPRPDDAGLNTFTVRATDLAGANADVTLTILVRVPLAHWHLNEPAGPTVYDPVGGFNGTAQGSLQFAQAGLPGAPAGNAAIQFNGSNTAVSIPALNLNTNTVTITALIKASGMQNTNAGIFFWRGGTTGGLRMSSSNELVLSWNGFIYTSALVVPTNQWVFVAVTVGPDMATFYLATNSTVSSDTSADTFAVIAFDSSAYIGYDSGGSTRRFNGTMDDVAVYGTTLGDPEINQLAANAFTPVTNAPPICVADATTTPESTPVTISVLANDSDPSGLPLSIQSITQPAHGSASISGTNVVYTPTGPYWYGSDSFTYNANDSLGAVASATVNVTVAFSNHAPTFPTNPFSLANAHIGQKFASTLVGKATDVDAGDVLMYSKLSGPAWLQVSTDGLVSGTPQAGDCGLNTFTVRVTDASAATADATLTVNLNCPMANWRLNESSGPTLYDYMGAFNGTAVGSLVYTQAGAQATAGNFAVKFNGSDAAVSFPALNLNTNVLTMTALIKRNGNQATSAGIVFWRGTAGFGLRFGDATTSTNRLAFVWNGFVWTTGLTVPDNQWTFVAASVGPDITTIYMATNSTISSSVLGGPFINAAFSSAAYLGYDTGGATRRFNGTMDDAAMYGRTLGSAEISDLAATALAPAAPVVTLTSPADGATLTNGTINLSASVVSNNHSIASVRFYDGLAFLGEDTTTPYSFDWSGMTNGSHAVSATALYEAGNFIGSAPITVHVTNAPPSGYVAWAGAITNGLINYDQCATCDGYPNLLKYATGSSPTNSDNLAKLNAAKATNGFFVLNFNRNTNASDITLIAEGSYGATNDAAWNGIATNISGSWGGAPNVTESGTGTPVTVTVQDAASPATNRFLRLRVTRP